MEKMLIELLVNLENHKDHHSPEHFAAVHLIAHSAPHFPKAEILITINPKAHTACFWSSLLVLRNVSLCKRWRVVSSHFEKVDWCRRQAGIWIRRNAPSIEAGTKSGSISSYTCSIIRIMHIHHDHWHQLSCEQRQELCWYKFHTLGHTPVPFGFY